jgi:hypothetical protein
LTLPGRQLQNWRSMERKIDAALALMMAIGRDDEEEGR